ncbi:MAG: hypothetical protein ACFFD1_11725 [Candidatus Thorarchaeota archaeon]
MSSVRAINKRKKIKKNPMNNTFVNSKLCWDNLASILNKFGVNNKNNKMFLSWDQPDTEQFNFLTKMFHQLTNTNIFGSYDKWDNRWEISH